MNDVRSSTSRYAVTILAVAAVAAANVLLWTMRPTADPVTPETVRERPPAEAAATVAEPAPRPIPMDPREPLDLELDIGPSDHDLGRGTVLAALRERPYLELEPPEPAREVETGAAEPEPDMRGVRLSDNLLLHGGIGLIEDPKTREHDYAIGIGIDLTY